jgi:1,4-dihydroxy-2-naphthoate octaprenyltransferase
VPVVEVDPTFDPVRGTDETEPETVLGGTFVDTEVEAVLVSTVVLGLLAGAVLVSCLLVLVADEDVVPVSPPRFASFEAIKAFLPQPSQ